MVKWICTHCNFRFEADKPNDCPYCGKKSLEKEPNAEELLDEIGGILDN